MLDEITSAKKQLRSQMLSQRNSLNPDWKNKYDTLCCSYIYERIHKRGATSVHSYIPMGSEINILALLNQLLEDGIQIVTPKTLKNRQLEHLILDDLSELESGLFNTQHPNSKQIYTGSYDLILVPGLAFDYNSYRLGYGGGYYDNFLKNHPDSWTIGLAYPFQYLKEVPRESHDIQLKEIYRGV